MAIVFPFSVDDKESNSSSGGDGKTKTSPAAGNNSNNSSTKNVNSNFSESTDKGNSTNKTTAPAPSSTPSSEQSVTISAKSVDSETGKGSPTTATKANNNCDALSDVINNAIDTSGIKMEIKDDPDAPKVTKSVNNIQPALGGSLLPPHAANAKHPVSRNVFCLFHALLISKLRLSTCSRRASKVREGKPSVVVVLI